MKWLVTHKLILFGLLFCLIINSGCVGFPDKDNPPKARLDLDLDPPPETPEDSAFDDLEPIIVLGAGETVKQFPCEKDKDCVPKCNKAGTNVITSTCENNKYCQKDNEMPCEPGTKCEQGKCVSLFIELKFDFDNDGIEDDVDLCADGSFADDRIDGPPNDRGVYKDLDSDNIRDACDTCASKPGVFSDNRVDENQNTVADMCELDIDNDNIPDFKDLCPNGETFADNRKDGNNDGISDNCVQTFSCPEGKICPSESTRIEFGNIWVGDDKTGHREYPPVSKIECQRTSIEPTSTGAVLTMTAYDYKNGEAIPDEIKRLGNECVLSGGAIRTKYCSRSITEHILDYEEIIKFNEETGIKYSSYSNSIPCSNFGQGFVCNEVVVIGNEQSPGFKSAYCGPP